MPATDRLEIPILTPRGSRCGSLVVSLLPTKSQSTDPPLLDLTADVDRDPSTEPFQLLEGHEYRYELAVETPLLLSTNKPEVFEPDTLNGRTGRLRPGLYTGWLSALVLAGDRELGTIAMEVRSRKLKYLYHYRWMLRDIANEFTELIMERFAAAEQRFQSSGTAEASTLYQRFAFLHSMLSTEPFRAALRQILARPYAAWEEVPEQRHPGQGLRPSSHLLRQLTGPGPRVDVPQPLAGLRSIPGTVSLLRTEVTVDNPPNRFVKFALTRWRDLAAQVAEALGREPLTAPVRRGLKETEATRDDLEAILAEELFREVGDLTHFPADNQVLQKREGYRDVFRAYIQFEIAAKLSWQALEDSYRAGQRDVSTLYEYWAFIQLAKTTAEFCGRTFDLASLLEPNTLGIRLREGHHTVISGTAVHRGRRLRLELSYNRTFGTRGKPERSWTRPMRPDCSLRIAPEAERDSTFVPVWLHFDAKYRVESLEELLGASLESDAEEDLVVEDVKAADKRGQVKRGDLLKMHAYRDAIQRSAGAYVLYPGTDVERCREYHELLPGLGAFALQPVSDESGVPVGIPFLRRFIGDVLDHVASHVTQHERCRFWVKSVYDERAKVDKAIMWAPFLPRPPADTWVALGHVTNPGVLDWIEQHSLFPVCVDGTGGPLFDPRSLTADLVLLYGPATSRTRLYLTRPESELYSAKRLREAGFPETLGQFYYCLRLQEIDLGQWQSHLTHRLVLDAIQKRHPEAMPESVVALTWLDLIL